MRVFLLALYFIIAGTSGISPIAAQVAAVKFTVIVPPFGDRKDSSVHLVGSFNGWRPHDSLYIMKPEGGNAYSLLVPLFDGINYQYKYTLGSWNNVEIKMNDSDVTNRQFYSRNGMILYDTVSKWKVAASPGPKSAQMQKLTAIKDSAGVELQGMLKDLLVIIKKYNENMLAPKPNERIHRKLNKQTIEIIAKVFGTIESRIWDVGMSLTPEQKQKILAAIKDPAASGDILNTIKNAYANALK